MAQESVPGLMAIPGIGRARAAQLAAKGIHTVEEFLDATPEEIASVRGLSLVQAREMKSWANHELAGDQSPQAPAEDEDVTLGSLRADILRHVSELLGSSGEHALSARFRRQLTRLRDVLVDVPADLPPDDAEEHATILKHLRSLQRLLSNAHCLAKGDKMHQKVLGERIRVRRRKLSRHV